MKAAVLERFNAPLVVREVPVPVPGPGEVLVRTRASCLCQTDLKVLGGVIPTVKTPRIIGHELAGEVAALGPGAAGVPGGAGGLKEGDRVIAALDIVCGTCAYCQVGKLDYCLALRRLGFEHDGAHAEFVRLPARNIVPIPPAVSFEQGAAIPDAMGSIYHAIKVRGDVRPGQTVAIYGLGGLGFSGVQIAGLAGARVIAIARSPARRKLAQELGAAEAIDPEAGDLVDAVRRASGGLGVDLFVDLVGIEGSIEKAVRACRKGGRVVVVGYLVPAFRVTTMHLVYNEVQILGSRSSTRADFLEVAQLVAAGRIAPVLDERLALEEVNAGYARLQEGKVIGRSLIVMP
jgi:propanol-preferring alcohol dehydrogenase